MSPDQPRPPDLDLEFPTGPFLEFPDEPPTPEALYAWRLRRNLLWHARDPEGRERQAPVNVPFELID